MATWQEFASDAPQLAAYGIQRLAGRVAYLATIRADGSPRVHPVALHMVQGHLFTYMDPNSPKGHDLQRDGRYALHCSVEDVNGGEGEFSLRGLARFVEDALMRDLLFETARAAGFNPQDRYVVFELNIVSVLSTIYEGDQTIRKRWKAS